LRGVLAAPIYQVSPQMGADLIIVVFAVVVIGGMGSILGSIITGFGLGLIEGLTKVFYPEASNTVIFVIMAIVLLIKPGRPVRHPEVSMSTAMPVPRPPQPPKRRRARTRAIAFIVLLLLLARRPFIGLYPVFLMKVMCFALFACAFNLLLGFGGLLSFGHAMFLGAPATRPMRPRSGASARAGDAGGTAVRGRAGPGWSACWPSAARASTSR
jgi:branched-chain amino acid transport system permease protein